MSGRGGSGKRSVSERESDGTERGRRNESVRGREKGSENGRETETRTVIAGPERGSGSETGRGIEAGREVPTAADQGR